MIIQSQLKFRLKNSFRLNSSFLFELEFTLGINNCKISSFFFYKNGTTLVFYDIIECGLLYALDVVLCANDIINQRKEIIYDS